MQEYKYAQLVFKFCRAIKEILEYTCGSLTVNITSHKLLYITIIELNNIFNQN